MSRWKRGALSPRSGGSAADPGGDRRTYRLPRRLDAASHQETIVKRFCLPRGRLEAEALGAAARRLGHPLAQPLVGHQPRQALRDSLDIAAVKKEAGMP